jgi:hypothetical protein
VWSVAGREFGTQGAQTGGTDYQQMDRQGPASMATGGYPTDKWDRLDDMTPVQVFDILEFMRVARQKAGFRNSSAFFV